MATIYKSADGREEILRLYHAQLDRLPVPYEDVTVATSFGDTHLIVTGNPQGVPLLMFHGGNATTAYMLLSCGFLLDAFKVYVLPQAERIIPDCTTYIIRDRGHIYALTSAEQRMIIDFLS